MDVSSYGIIPRLKYGVGSWVEVNINDIESDKDKD